MIESIKKKVLNNLDLLEYLHIILFLHSRKDNFVVINLISLNILIKFQFKLGKSKFMILLKRN